MLLVNFVRHDSYEKVTRITHDKDKEHTNIYKLVCGKEECVATIRTENLTGIYDDDNKEKNMIDMWLMNKGLVSFQEGEKGYRG
jgi:hypothetical protein